MSVSTVSKANVLAEIQQSRMSLVNSTGEQASSFAAVLNTVRQADPDSAGVVANSVTSGNSSFASALSQAQNSVNPSVVNNNFGLADLYMYNSLQATSSQGLSAVDAISGISASESVGFNGSAEQSVNLDKFSLDFTSLLPQGIKSFMKDLKCSPDEMNSFVNVMVFGTEQGPQGQNAAEYFGKAEMTSDELASSLQDVLSNARINTWEVTGQDFNFLLSNQGAAVGQTLAAERGLSLEHRAMERDLDSTYEKDMALMQILSRTNNQNASIF